MILSSEGITLYLLKIDCFLQATTSYIKVHILHHKHRVSNSRNLINIGSNFPVLSLHTFEAYCRLAMEVLPDLLGKLEGRRREH